jgi:hypothetical protein
MIRALFVGAVVFLVSTFPSTWLLMLFFGNLHFHLGYWAMLPLGVLVSMLLSGTSATRLTAVRVRG